MSVVFCLSPVSRLLDASLSCPCFKLCSGEEEKSVIRLFSFLFACVELILSSTLVQLCWRVMELEHRRVQGDHKNLIEGDGGRWEGYLINKENGKSCHNCLRVYFSKPGPSRRG